METATLCKKRIPMFPTKLLPLRHQVAGAHARSTSRRAHKTVKLNASAYISKIISRRGLRSSGILRSV